MPYIDVKYKGGTIKTPQQTKLTEAAFTSTNHVHFPDGRLRTIPKYTSISDSPKGGCRSIFSAKRTGTNVGTFRYYGTHTRLYVKKGSVLYNITPLKTSSVALGTDPFNVTNGDNTVIVTHASHGLSDGDRIKISGASGAFPAGTSAADFNVEHIITYINTNSYSVEIASTPSATDTTVGGAACVVYKPIDAGNLDQGMASGVGCGVVGMGIVGVGGSSATSESFPRIWSFASFGNDVVMCPGDYASGDGQKIYIWDGDTSVAPTVLTGAPTDCNWVSVVNNSVVALCGDTLKISAFGDALTWSGITYYANQLQRVWKLIACYNIGTNAAVIFTPTESFLLQWVGEPNLWDVSDLNPSDGIIAPMAACNLGGLLFWQGNTGMFQYDGGAAAVRLENPQNGDWILQNINNSQRWKTFLMTDEVYEQFYMFFPTSANNNPSDYVIANPANGTFTLGLMDRTAAQRPGFVDSQFVMANGTDANAGTVYRHFMTGDATSEWHAQTAYSYASDGGSRGYITQFLPDSYQSGDITLNLFGKERAQGAEITCGSWDIASDTEIQTVKAAGKLLSLKLSGSGQADIGAWRYMVEVP